MKRFVAIFFALCLSAFGVDTIAPVNTGGAMTKIEWNWTSDASGDAVGVTTELVPGLLYSVTTTPDGTDIPTDNYDIAIKNQFVDVDGNDVVINVDRATSLLLNRDQTNTELVEVWPQLNTTQGKLRIEVSNAGNAKQGRITVVVFKTLAITTTGGGLNGLPVGGATTQLLQWASNGQGKWATVSGEAAMADGGALDITNVSLADLGTDPVGRLKFGNSSDFYAGYDGTNNVLAVYEGVGGDERFIINDTASSSDEPFSFGFGKDWSTWESWNGALSHYERLHNWHFFSPSEVDAVMEIESGGDTTLTIEAGANGGAAKSGYIAWQRGNALNTWSLGSKGSDSDAFVLDDGFSLGVNPVLHIARSGYLMTYAGAIDGKDFYNNDVATILANLNATVGGISVAPNKNIATLTAAGNTAARVHLEDLDGTANRRINEITTDADQFSFIRRVDAGTSTTMLSFSNADSAATFTANVSVNGNTTLGDASTDTITSNGRLSIRSVTDAGPMTATAGTARELVWNTSDSKVYVCTTTGSPATWAALN